MIIRFNDVEKAKEFIDNILESSDSVTKAIKKVSFSFKEQNSFSIEIGLHVLAKLMLCFI